MNRTNLEKRIVKIGRIYVKLIGLLIATQPEKEHEDRIKNYSIMYAKAIREEVDRYMKLVKSEHCDGDCKNCKENSENIFTELIKPEDPSFN